VILTKPAFLALALNICYSRQISDVAPLHFFTFLHLAQRNVNPRYLGTLLKVKKIDKFSR
jgi:hypothetical protein